LPEKTSEEGLYAGQCPLGAPPHTLHFQATVFVDCLATPLPVAMMRHYFFRLGPGTLIGAASTGSTAVGIRGGERGVGVGRGAAIFLLGLLCDRGETTGAPTVFAWESRRGVTVEHHRERCRVSPWWVVKVLLQFGHESDWRSPTDFEVGEAGRADKESGGGPAAATRE